MPKKLFSNKFLRWLIKYRNIWDKNGVLNHSGIKVFLDGIDNETLEWLKFHELEDEYSSVNAEYR